MTSYRLMPSPPSDAGASHATCMLEPSTPETATAPMAEGTAASVVAEAGDEAADGP